MEERKDGRIGKTILVIFEDGENRDGSVHISKKEGLCTDVNSLGLELDSKHTIPHSRIVRTKVLQ